MAIYYYNINHNLRHNVVQKYNAGQNKSFSGGAGGEPFSKGSPRAGFGAAAPCGKAAKKPTKPTKQKIKGKVNRNVKSAIPKKSRKEQHKQTD